MRAMVIAIAGLLVAALAPPARAGITVTSYRTVAQVNGYAPVSQAQYYAEQRLENVSPALAEVSGDWMGPNAGGTTNTWHYVGSARSASTTTFNADSLTVTGDASFAYTVDTTPDFIDPGGPTVFRPGAAANYNGFFDTDVSTSYAITARLFQWGRVRLNSLDGSAVFDQTNATTTPLDVSFSGTIPAGAYLVRITASLGAGNLPSGVNHFEAGGGFENATFTVQVPEPNHIVLALWMIGTTLARRRKRCARAD